MKWLLAISAGLVALLCALLTLLPLGLATGPAGLAIGVLLAVVPVPVYMMIALWCDRMEKEPLWMLVVAFAWGASVAVFFAALLNTGFELLMTEPLGAQAGVATAVISAPLVEELAKACALFIFFLWKRDEFDGVLDGIIYATMVGLGFAMTENILYYGKALAQGGWGISILVFILRGVVSPFAHPLFTSMTGIGLGLSRQAGRGSRMKFFAPLLGLCAAMFMHFIWNLSASSGAIFFLAYAVVMVPAFAGLITIVAVSLGKERRIIREQLLGELQSGLIPFREHFALGTISGRIGAAWRAFREGGWSRWRTQLRFHNAASELAFHRWRVARGIMPRRETVAARELRCATQLQAIARQLGWASMPPPLVPPSTTAPPPGGRGGLLVVLGSLGCLGVIAVLAIGFGALVIIGAASRESPAPVVSDDKTTSERPLIELLPERLRSYQREKTTRLDSDLLAIYGALDGIRGQYSSDMRLTLLRYRSPELAAEAAAVVGATMFPAAEGWQREPTQRPVGTIEMQHQRMKRAALLSNRGALLVILAGDATRLKGFAAADEVLPDGR